MRKTKLTAHMIIKNEEQWVWYAIKSVLDHVDRILIFNTGSQDATLSLIQSFESPKIQIEEKGCVSPAQLVELRNEMIEKTSTEWFMLLDGDEIWTEPALKELEMELLKNNEQMSAYVSHAVVPVGDVFHRLPESTGKYEIKGKRGHLNIRIYKKQKGYTWKGTYPLEAYVDNDNIPIQEKINEITFLKNPYWHMTHMKRSSIDDHAKRKLEIGAEVKDRLPEVFFEARHPLVPSPWIHFTSSEHVRAKIMYSILRLKRSIL